MNPMLILSALGLVKDIAVALKGTPKAKRKAVKKKIAESAKKHAAEALTDEA
ncbi:MAG: hypothetical protein AB7K68_17600 [Bacteriovoracia bacterium]